jgi:hypothetical protein
MKSKLAGPGIEDKQSGRWRLGKGLDDTNISVGIDSPIFG